MIKIQFFVFISALFLTSFFFPPKTLSQSPPAKVKITGFSIQRGRYPIAQPNGNIPLPHYETTNIYGNLVNSNNFGLGGVVECAVDIVNTMPYIAEGSLVSSDGKLLYDIFFGNPIGTPLSEEEAAELASFVEKGGILYVSGMGWSGDTPGKGPEYNLLFQYLGVNDKFSETPFLPGLVQSNIPNDSPVTDGPFGVVGPMRHSSFRLFINDFLIPTVETGSSNNFIVHEAHIGGGYLVVTGEAMYTTPLIGDTDNRHYYLNLFSLPCRDDWRVEEEDNAVVLDVPSFKQGIKEYDDFEPVWEGQEYDNGNNLILDCDTNGDGATIAECGCALTSAAMVAKYHGVNLAPDSSEVSPETLNFYMRQGLDLLGSKGFYNGNVNWYAVSNFSASANKSLKERFGDEHNQPKLELPVREGFNVDRIKELIDNNKPVIVKVDGTNGEHWVVVKGYEPDTNRLIINDPAEPDPESGEFSYLDKYTPVNHGSMIVYDQTFSDFRYLQFVTSSDNNISVTDESGNQVPNLEETFDKYYGDATSENTLDASDEGVHVHTIRLLENGLYSVNVSSKDGLPHPFTVYSSDKEGNLSFNSYMPTNSDAQYEFLYDDKVAGIKVLQVVEIDIRPFSKNDKINLNSNAAIPVSILSSNTFNATQINEDSLKLGASGNENSIHFCHKKDEDINEDGLKDKTCWFRVESMDLNSSSIDVILIGEVDGNNFISTHPVHLQ